MVDACPMFVSAKISLLGDSLYQSSRNTRRIMTSVWKSDTFNTGYIHLVSTKKENNYKISRQRL